MTPQKGRGVDDYSVLLRDNSLFRINTRVFPAIPFYFTDSDQTVHLESNSCRALGI